MSSKTWSKRFTRPVAELMERFNASIPFDCRLAAEELEVSIAHARMLGRCRILTRAQASRIVAGLKQLQARVAAGAFRWRLADEDVHTAVERQLTRLVGDDGKRLHTGRSRNDQVSTVVRLWLRKTIDAQQQLLADARLALLDQARAHLKSPLPGFTHLQVAQPTTVAHHLHAHVCALERDAQRLAQCRERVNTLPLGAAALAGTSFPIDSDWVAGELGFARVCPNTMDAVADRDFAIEYACACAQLMIHLSRLGEEIVIWCSQPFGIVRVGDEYSTGSSIMPQKRNPDAAELLRGKAGRVAGHAMSLMMQAKGQPLAYNKDNQEDKEALFDAADTVSICLEVTAGMVAGLQFDVQAASKIAESGYATATELADRLVISGMPFRQAHSVVAGLVQLAEDQGVQLAQIDAGELASRTGLPAGEVRKALRLEGAVMGKRGPGAPAPKSMARALAASRARARSDKKS